MRRPLILLLLLEKCVQCVDIFCADLLLYQATVKQHGLIGRYKQQERLKPVQISNEVSTIQSQDTGVCSSYALNIV